MASKRQISVGYIGSMPAMERPRYRVVENALPHSLGGQRIQQVNLPSKYLEPALKKRTLTTAKVAPSNLAEVRARLKKETKVG